MSFLDRIFGREKRADTITTSDPFLAEFFGYNGGLLSSVDTQRAIGL